MCKVRGPATAGSLLGGFSDSSGTVPPWLPRPSLSQVEPHPDPEPGADSRRWWLEARPVPRSPSVCAPRLRPGPSGLAVGPADSALRRPPGPGGPSCRHPGRPAGTQLQGWDARRVPQARDGVPAVPLTLGKPPRCCESLAPLLLAEHRGVEETRPVKRRHLGAPCRPRGSDSRLCPGLGWLSPWVGELRSCKLCRAAKKKKKRG